MAISFLVICVRALSFVWRCVTNLRCLSKHFLCLSQFPGRMYVRPPVGYPAQSPAQPSGGPPTPTFSPHQHPSVGPPPYGAGGPSTPTDSGYFGSVPNMHHMSGPVPSPLSRGVRCHCSLYCSYHCFKISVCVIVSIASLLLCLNVCPI